MGPDVDVIVIKMVTYARENNDKVSTIVKTRKGGESREVPTGSSGPSSLATLGCRPPKVIPTRPCRGCKKDVTVGDDGVMFTSRHSWHIACYEKFEKKGDDICLGCKDKIEPFDTDVVETHRGYRWHKFCYEYHVAIERCNEHYKQIEANICPGCDELIGYKFCRSNSGRLWCTRCWQNSGEGDDYRFAEGTKAARLKKYGKSYSQRTPWKNYAQRFGKYYSQRTAWRDSKEYSTKGSVASA